MWILCLIGILCLLDMLKPFHKDHWALYLKLMKPINASVLISSHVQIQCFVLVKWSYHAQKNKCLVSTTRFRLHHWIPQKSQKPHSSPQQMQHLQKQMSRKNMHCHIFLMVINKLEKKSSAVTETVPELETAVFCQNRGEPKPRFFGAKWIRFRLPTFVFIYGTKPMSRFRRGDWRYLKSLQCRLNLPI